MNIDSIRLLILILAYMIAFQILKRKQVSSKSKKIILIVIYIVYVASFYLAPELLFLKFKRMEDAFKYSFPNYEIIFRNEIEDNGFIIYKDDDVRDIIVFHKSKDKWKFVLPVTINHLIDSEYFTIIYKKVNKTDNYMVYLDAKRSENNPEDVVDSLGNEYNEHIINNKKHNYYYYIENMPNDYYILIEGEKIEIEKY